MDSKKNSNQELNIDIKRQYNKILRSTLENKILENDYKIIYDSLKKAKTASEFKEQIYDKLVNATKTLIETDVAKENNPVMTRNFIAMYDDIKMKIDNFINEINKVEIKPQVKSKIDTKNQNQVLNETKFTDRFPKNMESKVDAILNKKEKKLQDTKNKLNIR